MRLSFCLSMVIVTGLVSEAGYPPSCQLYVLVGIGGKGSWWGLAGVVKAASELGKVLPELQEGNSLVSDRPISKSGQLYSLRGH